MNKTEVIYGYHAVHAVLMRFPERVLEIWLQEGVASDKRQPIEELCKQFGIAVQWQSAKTFKQHLDRCVHQGVAAKVRTVPTLTEGALFDAVESTSDDAFYLVLDAVTDPNNLGACLRSADGAGVHGVILPKDKSAMLTPAARKIASGAAEFVPVYQVTNLVRCLQKMQQCGIWVMGTDCCPDAKVLYQCDLKGPLALVMGAEGKGLRSLTRRVCDGLISIPMQGALESLNVSVATGVCLYEAVRQRQSASADPR